jgi:4-hydroxy-L-threonine phosphate dehydrogenase PdxA
VMSQRKIAIGLGDPAGIGPEIALKAALDERVTSTCRPLLVGDRRAVEIHAAASGLKPKLRAFKSAAEVDWSADGVLMIDLDQFKTEPLELGLIKAAHGRAAVDAARTAIEAAMAGRVDAVVAAPQTERAIKEAGIEFDGYPSFVARVTGTPPEDVFLMHCFDDKRIVHVSLHVSLVRAIALVTEPRVLQAVRAAQDTLQRLGIASPRLCCSGLNPHAGEEGMFGDEEIRIIEPALHAAREAGIKVEGPFGADTMFHRTGYDAFIVMFHDQGHIASKLLARNRVAGLAIGTPVLFSSVAHGSGLDIAGQNKASAEAMVEAVRRLVGAAEKRKAA